MSRNRHSLAPCGEGSKPWTRATDRRGNRDHACREEPTEKGHTRAEEREAEQDSHRKGFSVAAFLANVSFRDGLAIAGRSDEQGRRIAVQISEAGPREDRREHVSDAQEDEEELVQG